MYLKPNTATAAWDSQGELTKDEDTERRRRGLMDVYYGQKQYFKSVGEEWRYQ